MDYFFKSEQQSSPIEYNTGSHNHHSLFFDDELQTDELQEEGKEFYTFVRTHVIYFITIILLYTLSCALISHFSKQREDFRLDIEEYRTYKISTWMCAFTLAISIAAFLLLPVSITTKEISWIDDAKTKWSLLDGMWSYVFLFSNLSLFILLPFAYFFTESEGFSGSRRGMLSRLRETCVLLIIAAILLLGLTYTVGCLSFGIGCHVSGIQLLTIWQYLPFLYSCISFIGALLLLLCTPLGISHLFTVLHQTQSIKNAKKWNYAALILLVALAGYSIVLVLVNTFQLLVGFRSLPLSTSLSLAQQRQQKTYQDNHDSIVSQNTQYDRTGNEKNGPIGAFLDIVMVLYLWSASLCGLYNLPGLCCLRPRAHNSSFNQIIGNCTILCLLSSALPLLARTLGMTNFDLLANFGRIEWLGNFYVVLLYNVVFFVSTTLCLMGKRELVLTINLFKAVIGNPHQRTKLVNKTNNSHQTENETSLSGAAESTLDSNITNEDKKQNGDGSKDSNHLSTEKNKDD